MNAKAKGTNAERELIHLFWSKGWAAIRVAGSGSSSYPCPDILAASSGSGRRLAIECKSSGDLSRHLPSQQVGDLVKFGEIFGAEPWIGVRFNGTGWAFFSPDGLRRTGTAFSVSLKMVNEKGLSLDQLLGIF